jgi:hypothetical protein
MSCRVRIVVSHCETGRYGFGMLAAGVILLAAAIALALGSWRSGLPVERVESYT